MRALEPTVVALVLAGSFGSPAPQAASLVESYQAACVAGDGKGCLELASVYEFGLGGVEKDEKRATQLYAKACQSSTTAELRRQSCTTAGHRYRSASGVAKNEAKAAALFDLGCDADEPISCINLAQQYETGKGIAADRARAAQLNKKGVALERQRCDTDDVAESCWSLAIMYDDGHAGLEHDAEQALRFYKRACGLGDDTFPMDDACSRAGGAVSEVTREASGPHWIAST